MNKLLAILALSLMSLSANADSWAWDSEELVVAETISWEWDDSTTVLEYSEDTSWSWE